MVAIPNDLSFLKAQLLDVQRLLKLAANHPLMSKAFSFRERELRERICQAEEQKANASSVVAHK